MSIFDLNGEYGDPPPTVIEILSKIEAINDLSESEREELLAAIRFVLAEWWLNEDLRQLKQLLGLIGKRGARRKRRTGLREYKMTMYVFAEMMGGLNEAAAKEEIATKFDADIRDVQRAFKKWRDQVEAEIRSGALNVFDETTGNQLFLS